MKINRNQISSINDNYYKIIFDNPIKMPKFNQNKDFKIHLKVIFSQDLFNKYEIKDDILGMSIMIKMLNNGFYVNGNQFNLSRFIQFIDEKCMRNYEDSIFGKILIESGYQYTHNTTLRLASPYDIIEL
jgi:hypothetical protein